MNTREIKQLIDKFYEGETTLAEEKLLREFFAGSDIPEELSAHKPVFDFFSLEQKQEGSARIGDHVFSEEKKGKEGRVIRMSSRRNQRFHVISLAASVVILAGIAIAIVMNINQRDHFTRQDQMAYAQAKEALMIVSSNFNTGASQLRYLGAFDKGMSQMRTFSEFFKYQTIITIPGEVKPSSGTNTIEP